MKKAGLSARLIVLLAIPFFLIVLVVYLATSRSDNVVTFDTTSTSTTQPTNPLSSTTTLQKSSIDDLVPRKTSYQAVRPLWHHQPQQAPEPMRRLGRPNRQKQQLVKVLVQLRQTQRPLALLRVKRVCVLQVRRPAQSQDRSMLG